VILEKCSSTTLYNFELHGRLKTNNQKQLPGKGAPGVNPKPSTSILQRFFFARNSLYNKLLTSQHKPFVQTAQKVSGYIRHQDEMPLVVHVRVVM
jgi:hypothetical protein